TTWRRRMQLAGQLVDLGREHEVVLGGSRLRMSREHHLDLAPGDVDVRVVVQLLRGRDERADELDGADEVAAVEALANRSAGELPAAQAGEALGALLVAQAGHDPA